MPKPLTCTYVGGLGKIFSTNKKWIQSGYIRTVNGQTFVVRAAAHQTYTHQKTKSEIGLHHGIFVFRHLGEMLNTQL